MADHRQHAENPLAIGERRLSARTPVSPQAFVKFGANNYGFVFNISESGLVFAPTGTLTLAVGGVAKMRFLLPESREWIETSGEVAWIAESQKEAGVRFVDLGHDTREKIRNWISQEPSRAPSTHQGIAVPGLEKNAADGARAHASSSGVGMQPATFVDGTALNSILADPAKLLLATKGARGKVAPQQETSAEDEPTQSTSTVHVPERRSQIRRRVLSLEYIDLGSSNGGILLNLSEGGMYVQAVAGLSGDDFPEISFRLPDSGYLVKTNAHIVWMGESKKDAGIQFLNLPEEARLKIRAWVALEHPPVQVAKDVETKVAPVAKKNERLLEMPAPGQPKKAVISPEIPALIPQRPDSAIVPPPSAASEVRVVPKPPELLHLSGPILQAGDNAPRVVSETASVEVGSSGVTQRRTWRTLVATIVVAVFISFIAGWIAAGPGGRKQFLAMFERQQSNSSDTSQDSATTPTSAGQVSDVPTAPTANVTAQEPAQRPSSSPSAATTTPDNSSRSTLSGNVQPLPSSGKTSNDLVAQRVPPPAPKPATPAARVNRPSPTVADKSRDTRTPEPKPSNTALNAPPTAAQNKTQIRPTESTRPVLTPSVSNATVKDTLPITPSNASSQPSPSSASAQKPNAIPVAAQPSPARVESSPPPPLSPSAKPPEPVEVVKGIVTVSASPFPSIRVPPEMKSQVSKQGASLQMGQLISRVEPVYPEDAQHQRIEGVVKLHMLIDRDGNIQDIDKMTGPPLLVAAAANAVRQWRYKPTSLGGQPVEAGVDVTVVFRLQTVRAN